MDKSNLKIRKIKNKIFHILIFLITCFGILVLGILFYDIFSKGFSWLSKEFFLNNPSRFPKRAGIFPGLIGSFYLVMLTVLISVPIGVGCSIYLEEYAKDTKFTRFIKINISNLAGTPSIVYGLLGLAFFVKFAKFGTSILSGALTMSLVVLPIVIVASQEALKAVPQYFRHGSYAMGATKWQTIKKVVLPIAFPSILTGVILSISRAIGETAPIVMVGAATFIAGAPNGIMGNYTALPMTIYTWIGQPQKDFQNIAAAGIIVLLALLLISNAIAIILRNKYQKTYD